MSYRPSSREQRESLLRNLTGPWRDHILASHTGLAYKAYATNTYGGEKIREFYQEVDWRLGGRVNPVGLLAHLRNIEEMEQRHDATYYEKWQARRGPDRHLNRGVLARAIKLWSEHLPLLQVDAMCWPVRDEIRPVFARLTRQEIHAVAACWRVCEDAAPEMVRRLIAQSAVSP